MKKNVFLNITFLYLLVLYSSFVFANPYLKPSEGYVKVEGGNVWYRILGEGDERPLLMMHGGPGGTSNSLYLFEKLTKNRPIILFDQLGTGRSGRHEDTSLMKVEHFVAQVAGLKTHLNLDEYYLYGHSWGTALALEYYSTYPEGIKGIVFNSPYFSTAIWEADADTLIKNLPKTIQDAIAEGEKTGDFNSESYRKANTVFLANYGLRKKHRTSKLIKEKASGNYFMYNYMWGPTEFTANGTLKNYDIVYKLKSVTVPVLFITGEYDEARPTTVKRFQSMTPHAEYAEIKGAGHATMHDNLRQNRKVIKHFLDTLD